MEIQIKKATINRGMCLAYNYTQTELDFEFEDVEVDENGTPVLTVKQ